MIYEPYKKVLREIRLVGVKRISGKESWVLLYSEERLRKEKARLKLSSRNSHWRKWRYYYVIRIYDKVPT